MFAPSPLSGVAGAAVAAKTAEDGNADETGNAGATAAGGTAGSEPEEGRLLPCTLKSGEELETERG